MEYPDRPPGRRPAVLAARLLVAVVAVALAAAGCSQAKAKTTGLAAGPPTTMTLAAVAAVVATSTTDAPSTAPIATDPAVTSPSTTAPAVTTPPVTAAKQWVTIAEFSGTGDKEGNTFTITGAPARVVYKASNLFTLSIDTGDSFNDTIIGTCPAGGCTQQGAVHVLPGGWYFHVTGTVPATTYTVTLQEFR
jgi:hypothetical protein